MVMGKQRKFCEDLWAWWCGLWLVAVLVVLCGCEGRQAASVGVELVRGQVEEALERVLPGGGRLFVNQAAAEWFGDQGFGVWVLDGLGRRERLRAGLDPAFWRAQDRAARFDAVAVLGEPGDARPLVGHLLESPDWRLAWVGDPGCFFTRSSSGGEEPVIGQASERAAHWLIELGLTGEARAMMVKLRRDGVEGSHLDFLEVCLLAEDRDWSAVIERTASEVHGPFADAMRMLRARAFLERGEGKRAWKTSRPLAQRKDADAATLFFHARTCRAAHAWEEEVDTLKRLIAQLEEVGAPTAPYLVYLGQALASAGQREPALDVFRKALADPALPQAQREFAETAIRRLE